MVGQQDLQGGNFNVYPVPNDGHFSVTIKSDQERSYTLDIYNSLGVKVYEKQPIIANGTLVTPVDISSVPNGLYTIILHNADYQVTRKILVNK
jgi:hypothetical protein